MASFQAVNSEIILRAQLHAALGVLGVLFEKETLADVMNDEALRPFVGRVIQNELMPALPEEGREQAVIAACGYMSLKPVSEKCADCADGLIGEFALHILPKMNGETPLLTVCLAALIMLFAGVRKENGEYKIAGPDGQMLTIKKDENALSSFSRLSVDMDADSLVYAVLSDADIFGKDLRGADFEEKLLRDITDIQLAGLSEKIKK